MSTERKPQTLKLIFATARGLLWDRGWLLLAVTFSCSTPIWAYGMAVRFDIASYPPIQELVGPLPRLSDRLSVIWYVQKLTVLSTVTSAFLYGWLQALAVTLSTYIAIDWRAGQETRFSGRTRAIIPTALFVWGALILTQISIAFGLAVFVFPGLILAAVFCVAGPVAAHEKVTPLDAVKRSLDLTWCSRWLIFAFFAAFFAADFVWGWVRGGILFRVAMDSGIEPEQVFLFESVHRFVKQFLTNFFGIVLSCSAYLVLKETK